MTGHSPTTCGSICRLSPSHCRLAEWEIRGAEHREEDKLQVQDGRPGITAYWLAGALLLVGLRWAVACRSVVVFVAALVICGAGCVAGVQPARTAGHR
jgi:uncharacterized protein YdiU (UPF0061 family)